MTKKIDSIFKINNLKIGQIENREGVTGCTVLIFQEGAITGVDVRGGAPGTRETELLKPENMIEKIHAIVLTGGSAFGLDSLSGVMEYLEENKIGFKTEFGIVPIVTGAVLFDLNIGIPSIRPNKEMGYLAAKNATDKFFLEGNYGAGKGATIGKFKGISSAMKGGIGISTYEKNGLIISAIVAVNSWGNIIEDGKIIAGSLADDKKNFNKIEDYISENFSNSFSGNTTIGIVLTNAKLTKAQATKIAQMSHDGYARAINPVHTYYDGDTIFVSSLGEVEADANFVGIIAADMIKNAILNGVKSANTEAGYISFNDILKKN